MIILRFYLIIVGLALVGSILVGLFWRDPRWYRFAAQLAKFSFVLLLVIGAAIVIGRLVLL